MSPSLDIIIVNWNSGAQLHECLESLMEPAKTEVELRRVVVVDNASSDGSAGRLEFLELPLTVIRNPENLGFAAACNQGVKCSTADYLLFLNPDVRLFTNSLVGPARFMERPDNRAIGICGIRLVNEEGRALRSCARFPTAKVFLAEILGLHQLQSKRFRSHFISEADHRESGFVDHVTGAFLLVRHSLFEQLHGFDERFFVYLEDLDFSYRCKKAGWNSYFLSTAQAYHKGGGCSEQAKGTRLFYSLRSRILYGYKHFDWAAATGLLLVTVFLEPVSRLALAAAHGSLREMGETLQGFLLLWKALPSLTANSKSTTKV